MFFLPRILSFFILALTLSPAMGGVTIKSIARLADLQENFLSGYGLVIGLAGSGDSHSNKDTTQAIANVLQHFGVNINPQDIHSRNSAAVIVTVNLPPFAYAGDKLDAQVSSLADARSLVGGTLLVTPLKGTDNTIYALAQGPVSIGGFNYDRFGNAVEKNHPTTGIISNGVIVEKTLYNSMISKMGTLHLILNHADFTTADRIESTLNHHFNEPIAHALNAQSIEVKLPKSANGRLIRFISQLENTEIIPGSIPTVVVNERTGVVITGTDVQLDSVTISQGNLQVSISTEFEVSQPTFVQDVSQNVKTVITPSTQIRAKESVATVVSLPKGSTVSQLIHALARAKTGTRDMISILESLKRAGALRAELIIQ